MTSPAPTGKRSLMANDNCKRLLYFHFTVVCVFYLLFIYLSIFPSYYFFFNLSFTYLHLCWCLLFRLHFLSLYTLFYSWRKLIHSIYSVFCICHSSFECFTIFLLLLIRILFGFPDGKTLSFLSSVIYRAASSVILSAECARTRSANLTSTFTFV